MGNSRLEITVPRHCMLTADTPHILASFSFHQVECKFKRSSLLTPVFVCYPCFAQCILGVFFCFYLLLVSCYFLFHNTLAPELIPKELAPMKLLLTKMLRSS